jgi:hypothetical protein
MLALEAAAMVATLLAFFDHSCPTAILRVLRETEARQVSIAHLLPRALLVPSRNTDRGEKGFWECAAERSIDAGGCLGATRASWWAQAGEPHWRGRRRRKENVQVVQGLRIDKLKSTAVAKDDWLCVQVSRCYGATLEMLTKCAVRVDRGGITARLKWPTRHHLRRHAAR